MTFIRSRTSAAFLPGESLVTATTKLVCLDTNFRLGDTHSFGASVVGSQSRDLDGHETSGYLFNTTIQKAGQNLSYSLVNYALSPDFKTDVGFVRRTDQQVTYGQLSYAWWPENWLVSWGPSVSGNVPTAVDLLGK